MSNADVLDKRQRNELSIYGSGEVSAECLAVCVGEIKKAFPRLPDGWYDVLERALDAEGFTDERLFDATRTMIKTCVYPEPTIANLLSFDRTVKVFIYTELLEKSRDYSSSSRAEFLSQFGRINYYGELRYAKNEEIKQYNLTLWEK